MTTEPYRFIYRSARGEITARAVTDISESDDYVQGFCLFRGELRTFRKDRILELISDPSTVQERLEFHIANNPPPIERSLTGRTRPPSYLCDVCFTGFKQTDKKRLARWAEEAGFVVRKTVSQHLNFLCYGYNAGPAKMERARQQGVIIIDEEQFMYLLETGEVPDD